MLLCLHLNIAALNTPLACCHPELSILNHTPYAMNWSLHYTGRLTCSSLLHNSEHAGSSDNCGINVNWQLTELYVFTYSNYRTLTRLLPIWQEMAPYA